MRPLPRHRLTPPLSKPVHTAAAGQDVVRSVLPGGLRVISEYIPGVRSASVGIWIGVGSRDEGPTLAGAAHFLEHLLFKATPTRNAVTIAQDFDAAGGELNAFTAKEHTCFYAHVLDSDVDLAVDTLADVVLRGSCAARDVEVERDVVLEELAMRDDDHEDLLADAFMTALFGDHPMGRPIIGSTESIEAMSQHQIRGFHRRRYRPESMVVAVAGNIDHRQIRTAVRHAFADAVDRDVSHVRRLPRAPRRLADTVVLHRDSEQAHLLCGVAAAGLDSPAQPALQVLNTALGGGLSSRLFQQIREERGLAYSVYSSVDAYSDVSTFGVYAGCNPENLDEVASLTRTVIDDVVAQGITSDECERAKGSLRGALLLGLEDTGSRMHRLGSGELDPGPRRSIEQSLKRINAVTPAMVHRVAVETLSQPKAVAVVGPYTSKKSLPRGVFRI